MVIDWTTFDFDALFLDHGTVPMGKQRRKKDKRYTMNLYAAFDIETTNIYKKDPAGNIDPDFRPYAFMYHWQFCINDEVCFGRTWKEFKDLLDNLIEVNRVEQDHLLAIR